jgi:hypothetical protein
VILTAGSGPRELRKGGERHAANEGAGAHATVVTALVLLLFVAALVVWLALEWRVATAKPTLTEHEGDGGRPVWRIADRRRGIVYEFTDYEEALRHLELLLTDPGRRLQD